MSLIWRDELSTGLDWQDEQHKRIFEQISLLQDAMSQNQAKTVVKELVEFLENYYQTHFRDEEDYMVKHNHPNYVEHKRKHEKFIENYNKLKALYERQGASTMVVLHLQRLLHDWLVDHIMNVDKKMVMPESAKQM